MNPAKILKALTNPALLRFYAQRRLRGEARRDALSRFISGWIGRREFDGPSRLDPSRAATIASDLKRDGFAHLGTLLPRAEVERVHRSFAGKRCTDAYVKTKAEDFPAESPPEWANTAYFYSQDILPVSPLMEIANDPVILTGVQKFLGGTPTISDIRAWWSIPKRTARENQLFHRDIDDLKFCKLFIYLTDVGPEGGPHVYVRGSSGARECLHKLRYEDDEIAGTFGRDRMVTFYGEAGTVFLANTYGLHKGCAPVHKGRLIFVAQYSLLPVGLLEYEPLPLDVPAHFDRYVNRLFLAPRG